MKMKPRIVENLLAQTSRFPGGSVFGTGVVTQITEHGGLNGLLLCESLSAGRAWNTQSLTLIANQWYCMSFEVVDQVGMTSGNNDGFKFAGTAPNNGDSVIDAANILAGGNGRYACIFMDTVGGSFTYRLGVGLDSNTANKSLRIKNLMLETISINSGGLPSEYIYPQFKGAFNRANYSVIAANHRVVELFGDAYTVEPGCVILGIGDSKSDETTDTVGSINAALGRHGVAFIHAEGGWTTSDMVGPVTIKSQVCTSELAIAGSMMHRTFSTDGNEEMYDLRANGQLHPDIVVLNNIGVNDIAAGAADNLSIDTAVQNISTLCDQILAANKTPLLTEVSPWNASAAFSATAGDLVQTFVFNRRLMELAAEKGAIFTKLYSALGDSTDANKLSDGAGSTPDYSVDGLHLTQEGGRVVAGLILCDIQIWKQKRANGIA